MTPPSPVAYPRPDVPRLSLTERDRRWALVRELMVRDGVDVIIAPHNSSAWDQGNANGRYLSSVGGNCAWTSVVFPQRGEVTVVTGPIPDVGYWLQFQDWVTDLRPAFFDSTSSILDRVRELGLTEGRVGIAGMEGVARAPEGLVSHGTFRALRDALPAAEIVDVTPLMYEARFVKSAEEIELIQKSVDLVELAVGVLAAEARPGVAECVVYARMMSAMIEQGSEPSSLLLWAAGDPVPRAVAMMASRRRLAANDVIVVEIDGKWAGYLGHNAQTFCVAGPDATYREMAELQFEATQRCWEALRPGASLGDFVEVCRMAASDSPYSCEPILHSRGLGFDAPVLVYSARDARTRDWVVQENAVFAVKPRVSCADGSRSVLWGDTVVVRAGGAHRMGSLAPLLLR